MHKYWKSHHAHMSESDTSLASYKRWLSEQVFWWYTTVWKFHDFTITQIFREINFSNFAGP